MSFLSGKFFKNPAQQTQSLPFRLKDYMKPLSMFIILFKKCIEKQT